LIIAKKPLGGKGSRPGGDKAGRLSIWADVLGLHDFADLPVQIEEKNTKPELGHDTLQDPQKIPLLLLVENRQDVDALRITERYLRHCETSVKQDAEWIAGGVGDREVAAKPAAVNTPFTASPPPRKLLKGTKQ